MTDRTFYEPLNIEGAAPSAWDVMFAFAGNPKLQRGIGCSCYATRYYAVTARETDRPADEVTSLTVPAPDLSGYVVRNHLSRWPTDVDRTKRVQNAWIVRRIWRLVSEGHVAPSGLVVVAGETGSRKTTFAREIARRHISRVMDAEARREKKPDEIPERPHIVTCEDPIESWFAKSPEEASAAGFEYTPRQKGRDVRDLDEAVVDALRQKPALLYVNEVRTVADWQSLLFFAGTGHFAITTTHAGSLVETFGRILAAAQADTPAKRSEVANRIVAIVHVKKIAGEFVPALWVRTPRSRTALTQEGLGSLLPSAGGGCYGRAHFVQVLQLRSQVFTAAVKADLAGE